MKLGYVIQYVNDVKATVEFYEAAFDVKRRFVHESGAYAEMETGQTALAFVSEAMVGTLFKFRHNRPKDEPAGIEISFVTKDVQKAFDKALHSGAVRVLPPTPKPWGQIVSYVKDNNGCLVEICSPIGG